MCFGLTTDVEVTCTNESFYVCQADSRSLGKAGANGIQILDMKCDIPFRYDGTESKC